MMVVTGEPVVLFVSDRIGVEFKQRVTSLGLETDEGEIVSGIVFNNWTTNDIEATAASAPNVGMQKLLRRVGQYVFGELGCLRLTFTTEQDSVAELAIRLGAQPEGRKRNHFGKGRDAMILGVLREDWKV